MLSHVGTVAWRSKTLKRKTAALTHVGSGERLCEKSVMILNNYSCGWSVTSMNHRTGLDRSQTLLFPERLEDYIAAENPVRFVDDFTGFDPAHPDPVDTFVMPPLPSPAGCNCWLQLLAL